MDKYFRENTKRQKLAVEQSHLPRPKDDRQGIFSTDSSTVDVRTKDTRSRQRKKPALLPTPEKDSDADFIKTEQDDDYVPSTPHGTITDSKEDPEAAEESVERAAARAPAVNSSYLPLPWKGRLGYACLNTYLRAAKPSVFSSRTCRMASIIDHRHPLQDPTIPEHPTKNKPDKTQQPEHALGMQFVQQLGIANARDIVKMLRWNDKYGIKFMRLSSEMFPFASHPEHGYSLAPFASEVLAEAGKVAAELGHRLTTHPGQYTQLGSPRKEVVDSAIRDLAYHDELLSLLKLPEQQNRDAIMIIHMGGVFGDKSATLDRFRTNYARLPESIKARLVLENDDVSWSVHELLPVCEELNIPLVLDFHHHNIVFDSSKVREGTLDISQPELMNRILATWRRKNIRPKMHYSEPTAGAVTPRDRRKHSARVMTLPPCPPDMDLMIEAKDKEQAVFELMRTFKLPGFEKINDMIPHEREDEPKPPVKMVKAKDGGGRKKKKKGNEALGLEEAAVQVEVEQVEKATEVLPEDFGMGGPNNRVYWPLGREDWLKPKKRESTKKGAVDELDVKEEV
ncbi:UV-damage endonuclease [Coniochaeta pulveracea]|uniref:UV-damage endonuclease n=1 Tax=Coniochaeta pulveracea TaxID=177199 RepID=A0A420YGV9_9PEZI|nr:UV-damage endonuclease [Coniochaeta pulveracea]